MTACKTKHNSIWSKALSMPLTIMGLCLVLNLRSTCTDGKWAVIWPPNFATKYVGFATNFYTE